MSDTIVTRENIPETETGLSKKLYTAVWRWHFYAGLYVVPFLLILAVTGLMMVYFNVIETKYGEKIYIEPAGEMTSPISQSDAVQAFYPKGKIVEYMPPADLDRTALVQVTNAGETYIVSVNPYNNIIESSVVKGSSWYAWANDVHGEILIGDLGDRLMEIAAGLTIVLIVTGLYMWLPRGKGLKAVLLPKLSLTGRAFWKELHVTSGFYISVVLFFFLISGLSWAGIWGGQIVQPWSSFPAEKWDNVPLSDDIHASMNHTAVKEVPWGLELTKMPLSGSDAGLDGLPEGMPVNLSSINELAKAIGFGPKYRINLPGGETGVYTVSADSMDGDTETPTGDRTVHIDQFTGKILGGVSFDEYSPMAKAMAVGIALHQGDMGWWNIALNVLFCLTVIFLCISGIVMWWMRRPMNAVRLVAPPLPENMPLWKGAVFITLLLSLLFPLVGATLIFVLFIDLVLLKFIKPVRRVFQ